jgi:DNA-binding CsgD family transcriptional regulator
VPVAAADEAGALPDALAEALRRADLKALWQAVSALPPQQRSVLLMREFGGLRYDELALALGISEPAVESLLFRARRHLRAVLQPVYGASAVWESLARVFAGAGPAAAVKVGAATVGVAVLAGGAAEVVPSHHLRREHRVLVHRPAVPAQPPPAHSSPPAATPALTRTALAVARKPRPEREIEQRRPETREPERVEPLAEPSDDAVVSSVDLDLGDRFDDSGDSR